MEPVIFHVDLDAFYASVEQKDHEEYRGKPVIVGGTGNRGVVSACSYEARAYGVHSAMPMFQARSLCPGGIYVKGRMDRYSEMSSQVFSVLSGFSDDIHRISIDEAFLDMSGTERLFGIPRDAGALLKRTVLEKTGLIISVGIGPSKLIAKLASDYDKPNGLCRVSPSKVIEFIDTLSLSKIPGIGKVLLSRLNRAGFTSPQSLRECNRERLVQLFGESIGNFLHQVSRGEDPGMYERERKSHSISTETTFSEDISSTDILEQYLLEMAHALMFRLYSENVHSNTVSIKIKYNDFSTVSAQNALPGALISAEQVASQARALLRSRYREGSPVRLIGLSLLNVEKGDGDSQLEFFDDRHRKERAVEMSVLSLRTKGKPIEKASSLSIGRKEKSSP